VLFWTLEKRDGIFRIARQIKYPDRMWRNDPDRIVSFPVGTPDEEVIDGMIAILQAAAQV
jgi:hypothetical protein